MLLGYDGTVKVIDFGIAKAALSRTRTRVGIIKGKVRYMSPEQTLGRRLDARSDVFAAGTVLYEALTLLPGFSGRTESEHYADQTKAWLSNQAYPLRFHVEEVVEGADYRELFVPSAE